VILGANTDAFNSLGQAKALLLVVRKLNVRPLNLGPVDDDVAGDWLLVLSADGLLLFLSRNQSLYNRSLGLVS
jgi:hypothetical protein